MEDAVYDGRGSKSQISTASEPKTPQLSSQALAVGEKMARSASPNPSRGETGEALARIERAAHDRSKRLDLANLGLSEIPEEIIALGDVEHLTLRGNYIKSLESLQFLTNLDVIDLSNNPISKVDKDVFLLPLSGLYLNNTEVHSIDGIENARQLRDLRLDNTPISSIDFVRNLPFLETLWLDGTKIDDYSAISSIKLLSDLTLQDSSFSQFDILHQLQKLDSLWIGGTSIPDISYILGLRSLKYLTISKTHISNIYGIENLNQLRTLNISSTLVSDLSPISQLRDLRNLRISETLVDDLRATSELTSLSDGAQQKTGGMDWVGAPIIDPYLKALAHQENPERTVLAINYLRNIRGLPAYWPQGYNSSREFPVHDRGSPGEIIQDITSIDEQSLPQQISAPIQLITESGRPIRLAVENGCDYDPAQADLHEELLIAAAALSRACGQDNRRASLKLDADRYLSALGDGLQATRLRKLWSAGNTLRRLLEADRWARDSVDPDDIPLPELAAARLADLVDKHNAFSAGDGVLNELDGLSLGPFDRAESVITFGAATSLSRMLLVSPDVMELEAAQAVADVANSAVDSNSRRGTNVERFLRTAQHSLRNVAAAIIRAGWLTARSIASEGYKRWDQLAGSAMPAAGKVVGAATGLTATAGALYFIAQNAPELALLLQGTQGSGAAAQLLERVVELISKLKV